MGSLRFQTIYRRAFQNGKPDRLSQRPEYRPEKGGSKDQPIMTILSQKHFSLNTEIEQELISASKLN
jgi:hypothetical protein